MKSEYYKDIDRDEDMKVWRLGNCKNLREELVFDAFIDSEPAERA